jgi:hypothetical protein
MASMSKLGTMLAVVMVAVGGNAARGGFVTSGNLVPTAPPLSVLIGDLESNTQVSVFQERSGFLLTGDILVNLSAPGVASPVNLLNPSPTAILAGTAVDSYFLHSDPVSLVASFFGTVTFDREILGVILLPARLDASDAILGAPGTAYPTGELARGAEESSTELDAITLSADRRTLTVALRTLGRADQIRVVTASSLVVPTAPTPEPTSVVMLVVGAGVSVLGLRRRGRREIPTIA